MHYKLILTFPESIGWIRSGDISSSNFGGRYSDGSIDVAGKIIFVKENVDLMTPHEIIGGGKFFGIGHANI